MINRIKCRIGLHDWNYERMPPYLIRNYAQYWDIEVKVYSKLDYMCHHFVCTRCGKTENTRRHRNALMGRIIMENGD